MIYLTNVLGLKKLVIVTPPACMLAFSDGFSQLNDHNLAVSFSSKYLAVTLVNNGSSDYSPSLHQADWHHFEVCDTDSGNE